MVVEAGRAVEGGNVVRLIPSPAYGIHDVASDAVLSINITWLKIMRLDKPLKQALCKWSFVEMLSSLVHDAGPRIIRS